MYKDLIRYELADGVTEAYLISVATTIVDTWMAKQPGFLQWEITKEADGSYLDIVSWESKEAAKAAEAQMMNIPNGIDWFKCYKEGSIKNTPLAIIYSS